MLLTAVQGQVKQSEGQVFLVVHELYIIDFLFPGTKILKINDIHKSDASLLARSKK